MRGPAAALPAEQLRNAQLAFESLESRQLLATIVWANNVANADANWSTPDNWIGGVVPGSGDIASFVVPGTLGSGAAIEQPNLSADASISGILIDNR